LWLIINILRDAQILVRASLIILCANMRLNCSSTGMARRDASLNGRGRATGRQIACVLPIFCTDDTLPWLNLSTVVKLVVNSGPWAHVRVLNLPISGAILLIKCQPFRSTRHHCSHPASAAQGWTIFSSSLSEGKISDGNALLSHLQHESRCMLWWDTQMRDAPRRLTLQVCRYQSFPPCSRLPRPVLRRR
jgi:hypothetical protein